MHAFGITWLLDKQGTIMLKLTSKLLVANKHPRKTRMIIVGNLKKMDRIGATPKLATFVTPPANQDSFRQQTRLNSGA